MSSERPPPSLGGLGDTLRSLTDMAQRLQPVLDTGDEMLRRKRAGLCIQCGIEPIVRPGAVLCVVHERAAAHQAVDAVLDGGLGKLASVLRGGGR